jgi:hypothetical protein
MDRIGFLGGGSRHETALHGVLFSLARLLYDAVAAYTIKTRKLPLRRL